MVKIVKLILILSGYILIIFGEIGSFYSNVISITIIDSDYNLSVNIIKSSFYSKDKIMPAFYLLMFLNIVSGLFVLIVLVPPLAQFFPRKAKVLYWVIFASQALMAFSVIDNNPRDGTLALAAMVPLYLSIFVAARIQGLAGGRDRARVAHRS